VGIKSFEILRGGGAVSKSSRTLNAIRAGDENSVGKIPQRDCQRAAAAYFGRTNILLL
jgi:hypothetical protein